LKASLVRSCQFLASITSGVVALSGCVALFGWAVGSEPPKALIISGIAMKANSAACLVLCGGALLVLVSPERWPRWLVLIAKIAAVVVAVVGGLTLSEHISGRDLGIDQILFREAPGALGTTSPNRMGVPASSSFLLLGCGILLLNVRSRRVILPSQVIALLVSVIALLPIIGYAYQIEPLYEISRYTAIALHTAIAIGMLALSLLAARPTQGLMRIIVLDDAGGEMARRLLIPAIVIPFVLGWLRTLGQRYGVIDEAFGRPMLILSLILSFTTLVWVNARSLSILGRDRARIAEQREQLLISERAAREEAERGGRLKDEFLATVSHELRTPLNAILGYAQLLQDGRLDADTAEGLAIIERNARAQRQIIEDILDMSRIVTGKLRLDVREVDLVTVIDAAISTVRPAADAKLIHLSRIADPNAGIIRGDAARIQQIIWNLLSNAIKFTPRGGRVQVALEVDASAARLIVSDNGQGIAPDFLPQVFEKFRQADGSITRRHGGLGLGLSVVKNLVELHGGTVCAESGGEGMGATFIVMLPRAAIYAPPESPDNGRSDKPPPEPVDLPSLAGLTVLAVDDEPDARALIKRSLEAQGARVLTAASAAEAISVLDHERVDVVLSDIGMPEVDGYEFVRRLRARAHHKGGDVPAAALTAMAQAIDRVRALNAGYQAHVSKPVEPAELVLVVASLTGRVEQQSGST
jgi:signal transduction histidine kinase/CheY-like chemotaxis protein